MRREGDLAVSEFSKSHLLILAFIAGVFWLVPLHRIYGRLGLGKGWTWLALFPPIGMILLWIAAFARWPLEDEPRPDLRDGESN